MAFGHRVPAELWMQFGHPFVGPPATGTEGTFMRARIWLGILIGSSIGGLIPELWGADMFSYASVLLSSVGALAGLWIGYGIG